MDAFLFDCPHFFNNLNLDLTEHNDVIESYFETNHTSPKRNLQCKFEDSHFYNASLPTPRIGNLRKSLSTTNLHQMQKLEKEVENLTNILTETQDSNANVIENYRNRSNSTSCEKHMVNNESSSTTITSFSVTETVYKFDHNTPLKKKTINDHMKLYQRGNIPKSQTLTAKFRNGNKENFQPNVSNNTKIVSRQDSASKIVHAASVIKSTVSATSNCAKQTQLRKHLPKENIKPEIKKQLTNQKLKVGTIPKPPSFESRTKKLIEKREELILKLREEEQSRRNFQARSVPKGLYKSPKLKPILSTRCKSKNIVTPNKSDGSSSTHSSNSISNTDSNNVATLFKARSAKVLQMEPFVPKLAQRPIIEVDEFQFRTATRAKERAEFEKKKNERIEIAEYKRRLKEEENKRKEKEEIAKLRKEITPVAQPIRKYKPIKPVPSKPVTSPHTPTFVKEKIN